MRAGGPGTGGQETCLAPPYALGLQEIRQLGAVGGLLIGGVYALIALGLNIVFGTMRVINFAQGTILMAGMFGAYWLWALLGLHPYWSPLATVPGLFGLGWLIQWLFVGPLVARERAREPMSVLLLTLGLALVLENLALLFFAADFKTIPSGIGRQTFKVAGLIVSVPRLIGLGAMLLTGAALWLFFTRTDLGRAIRATGQDRQVARLMGIDDRRIYNVAFGLSAALMGIAAAVLVPFFYVHPAVGTSFLLKAFVIVVLGGLGSMPGRRWAASWSASSRAWWPSTCRRRPPRSCCSGCSWRWCSCGRRGCSESSASEPPGR